MKVVGNLKKGSISEDIALNIRPEVFKDGFETMFKLFEANEGRMDDRLVEVALDVPLYEIGRQLEPVLNTDFVDVKGIYPAITVIEDGDSVSMITNEKAVAISAEKDGSIFYVEIKLDELEKELNKQIKAGKGR